MNNSKPLVTIMIPTYNQHEFLPKAVESSLSQTYNNIEIIIADDCSTSVAAQSVLKNYASNPKVKVFINETNVGRVANYRKTLLERANGDWVINLDGDDYFLDDTFIEQAMAFINKKEGIVMISGVFMDLSPEGDLSPSRSNQGSPKVLEPEEAYEGIIGGSYFPFHGSTIYMRKKAVGVGFYTRNIISSDLESLLRLVQYGKAATIPSQSMVRRRHGKNASSSLTAKDFIDDSVTFQAPLAAHNNNSFVSRKFLNNWSKSYSFHKGKDNAYKILKHGKDNAGYIKYLRSIFQMHPSSAFLIFLQPKNFLKMIKNTFASR